MFHQEEPEHAVDTGEDPNPGDDALGPGHRAHGLSLHRMTDSDVPAGEEEEVLKQGHSCSVNIEDIITVHCGARVSRSRPHSTNQESVLSCQS